MLEQHDAVERPQNLDLFSLPTQLTSFIGREREIAEVKQLLASSRLVTLTGAGGCGKTRLALRVASDLRDHYADSVRWVELAPLADATLLPQAIAKALNAVEQPGCALLDVVLDLLLTKRLLLVLDNCEHLASACAEFVHDALCDAPQVNILATSREPLAVIGEMLYPVAPLALPPKSQVADIAPFDSIRLFVERARDVLPNFKLTSSNAPAIADICRRLDGIPLAIELASARVNALTVEQIAARLDDRFALLTSARHSVPSHHRTLRAALNWSYDSLSVQEQILLQRLSVFAGGFSLEAVEAVCAQKDEGGRMKDETETQANHFILHPSSFILDTLTSLVNKSLVVAETLKLGEARYAMLETIRQYAREKLIEAGKHESVQNRHLEYFMKLAEEAEPKLIGAEQMTWFKRLDSENDNLQTALDWSAGEDRVEKGLRLGGALYRFWLTRGYWNEGYRRLDNLVKIKGADKRNLARGKALSVAGNFANKTGSAEISRRLFEESVSILRETGAEGRPWLESTLGTFAFSLIHRDMDTAHTCAEETAQLSRESGNIAGYAQALIVLGIVARWKCDFTAALQCLEESRTLYQEIGDNRGVTAAMNNLVWSYIYQGDLEKAKELGEKSLTISREMGNKYHFASGLLRLGIICQVRGQSDEAESLLLQAISELRELGDKAYIAFALMYLGRLHLNKGSATRAHQELQESLVLFREVEALYFIPYLLDSFSFLLSALGSAQRAARLFGATQALRDKFGTPLPPVHHKEHESYLTSTRTQLDDATFNVAWNAGRVMTLDQAIEFALAEIKIQDTQDAPALSPRQIAKEKFGGLTAREREIAALIAQGKSNREIANTLVLSERTIEGHVSNILNKLGFNARSQIAAWAVQKGLEKN